MHRHNAPISLADLSAAGVRLRPYEAVTIVRELLRLVARGEVAGVPSAHVIRLSGAGVVSVEGPVAAGGRPVMRAAQLLDSLLPGADAGNQFRVPGGLKLIVARALGTLDLPPFPTLDDFAEALGRFAATDPASAVANLVVSWSEFVAARVPDAVEAEPTAAQIQPFVSSRTQDIRAHLAREPLTVSDIRRARRATGLPLSAIATRSHIPVGMLRQLEWGYFVNWPSGQYGRTQLVRYARSAGLDEQLVVSTLLPLIEQADRTALVAAGAHESSTADVDVIDADFAIPVAADSGRWQLSEAEPAGGLLRSGVVTAPTAPRERRRAALALAALAIPALLVIGLLPAWWARSAATPGSNPASTAVSRTAAVATSPAPRSPAVAKPTPAGTVASPAVASPAVVSPPPVVPTAAAARPQAPASPDPAEPATEAGAAEYRLASDRAAFSPAFASVGTAMFYHADESDRSPLVRAETGTDGSVLRITRIVDDAANNFHVRPSPDGNRIAFDSDRDGVRGVYVADADGKNVRRVSGEGFAAVPSWSPDAGRLAFVRAEAASPKVWNLWTLDLSNGETRQITNNKYGQPWGGSWFPDGRRIAYSHETRLIIRDLQTGEERIFNTPRKGHLIRTPAVSPDGRRIVFQVHRDGAWLLELGNGSMRRVLEDPTAEEYTWAPDGRRVAYHSRRSGAWGVWVMAPRLASR
jgi:hypothetical protein